MNLYYEVSHSLDSLGDTVFCRVVNPLMKIKSVFQLVTAGSAAFHCCFMYLLRQIVLTNKYQF